MRQNGYNSDVIKTDVIDIDNANHPLPPHLGAYEVYKVGEWKECPVEWRKDGRFIKIKEDEPFWIDLRRNEDCACLVSVQRLNPVTGEASDINAGLSKDPKQNYLRLPGQQWLDGYYNEGKVYQFKVTKAGKGLAVNENVLPEYIQDSHAIGIAFFAPKKESNKIEYVYMPNWGRPVPGNFYSRGEYTKAFHYWEANNRQKSICISRSIGGTTNPMWFSPTHTPHNWQTDSLEKLGSKNLSSGGASTSGSVIPPDTDVDETMMSFSDGDEGTTCCSFGEAAVEETEDHDDSLNILEENLKKDFAQAGVGAGGRIDQDVHKDDNSIEYYQDESVAMHIYYLVFEEQFEYIISQGKVDDSAKTDDVTEEGKVGGINIPLI